MGQLPHIESDYDTIANLLYDGIASRLLIAAIRLKVFDHLETPVSAEALAGRIHTHADNTRLMLDGLCACNLVTKEKGIYRNRPATAELLVAGRAAYLGDWLLQADEVCQNSLADLPAVIQKGPSVVTRGIHMNSEHSCEQFTAGHAATSLAGAGRDIAALVAALPEFDTFDTMLDMGGGPGINAMSVVSRHDSLRATLFDRPGIVRMAADYADAYGFGGRMTFVGGDYLNDSIGSEYDLVMVTDSLYYSDEKIGAVLSRCRQALAPGGVFVGIHAVLTHEETRPAPLVLGLLPEALAGQGGLPEEGFLVRVMERCGFEEITSKMVSIGGTPMEMNTARVG